MRPVTPHSSQGCRQNLAVAAVTRMEPTGRREAPPDDRLRAIRVSQRARRNGVVRIAAAITIPDFAPLHPGYASWNIVRWIEPLACAGRHGCEFPIQLSYSERMCVRILAARCARGLRRLPPSIRTRGRRESRVRAAPAVSCANMHKKTHTSIQVQRRHPGLPCAMVYGLLRALPGDRAFLPPSPARSFASRELDTSVGVSGPHGFTVRSSHARQSQLSRPPHPTARS
jgi:hypothetical protein